MTRLHQSSLAAETPASPDLILVVGNSARTLELLRLATIRSDDVVLISPDPHDALRLFASRFAIEIFERHPHAVDFARASAILIAIGEVDAENDHVRQARRLGVPIYVAGRDLVSDFSLLEFLEHRLPAPLAA